MSEPWNCTCVEHGDPIARLRDGYTAGASDPSAAHDEFDRLVRAVGLDSDHAAALEREAIAAYLERRSRSHGADVLALIGTGHNVAAASSIAARDALKHEADQIRNGAHHKEAR